MVIIVMGVAGSGKTTVGVALARALGWRLIDADDLHPATNIAKMSRGEPLSDLDREPWLDAVRTAIVGAQQGGESVVIACSALKRRYRSRLIGEPDARMTRETSQRAGVLFVYLQVPREVLAERLAARRNHFAGPDLLSSQLAALEEPAGEALVVDASQPPAAVVAAIRRELGRP
jgi:gluconokinase